MELNDLGPRGVVPAGALDWTTWTGRAYRHTPDPCEENPLTDQERAVITAARIRRYLDQHTTWADPDDPDNPANPANPANSGSDTVHHLRARLHDLATGLQPASPADQHASLGRPETSTGTDAWHFSLDRDRRRHQRQTEHQARQTPAPEETHPRHIRDLTDEPPF